MNAAPLAAPSTAPITAMQAAVDVVNTSLHPTSKVAATVFNEAFSISKTNAWPEAIRAAFGLEGRIGNSSGTVHAEISAILAAPCSAGAALCVTDPFCPNCVKNIAEAGIQTIYIDHKGFAKDFATRRHELFETLSMQICKRAGISVYEIHRKAGTILPILEIPADYRPANDSPVVISTLPEGGRAHFLDLIAQAHADLRGEKFALALAASPDGTTYGLCAKPHLALGYARRIDAPELREPTGKYSFIMEPLNSLLMNAARLGLRLHAGYIYTAIVPTAREMVNCTGAGLNRLHIGNPEEGRDDGAIPALRQLADAGIMQVSRL